MTTPVMEPRLVSPIVSDNQNKCYNTGVHWTPFFMKIIKQIFLSPITHINLMICGSLFLIGILHNQAHHSMETDADAYVFQFCKKNKKLCKSYVGVYD